jgi:hypothetical protein
MTGQILHYLSRLFHVKASVLRLTSIHRVFPVFNLGKWFGTPTSRFVYYTRVSKLFFNPILLFLLITLFYILLLLTLGGSVFCCPETSSIDPSEIPQPVPDMKPIIENVNDRHVYTIDRYLPNENKYECRLVFGDISRYLGASNEAIKQSMDFNIEIPTLQGTVYVGVDYITDQQWNTLMSKHPELLSEGISCTKEYYGNNLRPVIQTITYYIQYSC